VQTQLSQLQYENCVKLRIKLGNNTQTSFFAVSVQLKISYTQFYEFKEMDTLTGWMD